MFGTGKKINALRERVEKLEDFFRDAGQEQTARLEESVRESERSQSDRMEAGFRQAVQDRQEQFNTLSDQLVRLSSAANKHDMAIADMLDTWEELQEKQREEKQELETSLLEQYRQKEQEGVKREADLFRLLTAYHDQLHALRRSAEEAGDTVWTKQLALAEEKLSDSRIPAGVQVIDGAGVPVNYDLHEVMNVEETGNAALSMLVASVYTCGYAYRGKVLRKAGVSVYRYSEEKEREEAEAAKAAAEAEAAEAVKAAEEAEAAQTAEEAAAQTPSGTDAPKRRRKRRRRRRGRNGGVQQPEQTQETVQEPDDMAQEPEQEQEEEQEAAE